MNVLSLFDGMNKRRFSISEMCRLQTVPDDYFKVSKKTNASKMLVNGWTVDVIAHIFSSMNKEKEA